MEVKELKNYDMTRVISRAKKEFGTIIRGTEEEYNPGLGYLEHAIYEIYTENPITDTELKEVIEMIIYDLKGKIDNIEYDYKNIRKVNQIEFAKDLEQLFNPFINENIKKNLKQINLDNSDDLRKLFTFPIMCLLRIYDSIDFWNNHKGKNGYYRMLEELVIPIMQIGEHPFALEDQYLLDNIEID